MKAMIRFQLPDPKEMTMGRHDALRATWQPGQVWETRNEDCEQWVPVGDHGRAQPVWDERQEYRQRPASNPNTVDGARLAAAQELRDEHAAGVDACGEVKRG